MPQVDIGNAAPSDMANAISDVVVAAKSVEGATDQKETEWMNTRWTQQWGYFNSIPELKSAIILKAIWNVGKGWVSDSQTKVILEHISGWGQDTFDDILFNMEVVKRVGGDFYAEIIRDKDSGLLLNLKPLDPGSMKIVVNRAGIILRYEQMSKYKGDMAKVFKPEEILHICHNRFADQIHGISDIDAVEEVIKAENESFVDTKKIQHRGARPMILWKLKTDDKSKIAAFIAKIDAARNYGEDMFIPDDDDTVTHEVVQIDVSPSLMAWRDDLRKKFYRSIGLPELMPSGGGESTESGGKIGYLAFEQIVEKDQRYIEKQLWNQLQIKIDLIPPATLSQNLQADSQKDAGAAFQPADTTAGVGR